MNAKKINKENSRLEIHKLSKALMNLKFQKSTGQLEKTAEIKKTRRKIASLKTSLRMENN